MIIYSKEWQMTIVKNYLQGEITNFIPYRIGWRFYSNEFKIYFTLGNKLLHLWLVITFFSDGWVLQDPECHINL